MGRAARLATLVLAFGVCAAAAAHAAFNAFLNFGDIKGESTDKDHKDWISVESFTWGLPHAGTAATRAAAATRPALRSLTITKRLDKSSPLLSAACASGRHFNRVTLEQGYVRYELRDVVISSVKAGPTETLTLNFGSVTEERIAPPPARAGAVAPNRALVRHP
jgi:type VI secretion system secreted protein Hcp